MTSIHLASKSLEGRAAEDSIHADVNNTPLATKLKEHLLCEKILAQVWAKLIPNVTSRMIGPDDSFFDLGGHSILAQQMFFELRRKWRVIDTWARICSVSERACTADERRRGAAALNSAVSGNGSAGLSTLPFGFRGMRLRGMIQVGLLAGKQGP
jgi:hypothetical protein